MRLSPLDVRKQEFGRSLRGYDPHEVAAFLELVAAEMEEMARELAQLRERAAMLQSAVDDYRKVEQALQSTLVSTQQASDDSKRAAAKEAELAVREGELKAQRILDQARRKADDFERDIAALNEQRQAFIAKFRAFLQTQAHLLDAFEQGERVTTGRERRQSTDAEIDRMLVDLAAERARRHEPPSREVPRPPTDHEGRETQED